MDRNIDLQRLNRVAPIVAALAGAVVALLVAVLPEWRLEAMVATSGVADHFAVARSPLGATARSALALASGGGLALLVWAALHVAARRLSGDEDSAVETDAPVLRRADAHPDAPARRPLRASADLMVRATEDVASSTGESLPIGAGESPASVPAPSERLFPRDVPVDLDTPLASIDPAAIPEVPREPVRPVAPLARATPEERIETFELTPIRRTPAARPETPAPRTAGASTSLAALLERLEQGSARCPAPPTPPLSETLGMLRALATR